MKEADLLEVFRDYISRRHKLAMEEFSLTIFPLARQGESFTISGKYRVYSLGGFTFLATIDNQGNVSSFEERSIHEP